MRTCFGALCRRPLYGYHPIARVRIPRMLFPRIEITVMPFSSNLFAWTTNDLNVICPNTSIPNSRVKNTTSLMSFFFVLFWCDNGLKTFLRSLLNIYIIKSNKCKQTWKSETFHENFFGFEQWRNWKNWISAELGGILDFFFRYKDERGEAERVRDKVVRGEAECD